MRTGIPGWLLLVISFTVRTQAYTDLRGIPCMHEDIQSIPTNRAEWLGEITMTMLCDEGYDYPLNKPPGGRFICKPDGSPWQPSYIPDCNKEIFPIEVLEVMLLPVNPIYCNVDGTVANTARPDLWRDTVSRLDFAQLCATEGLGNCELISVSFHCVKPALNQLTGNLEWLQRVEDPQVPFLYVLVQAIYSQSVTYSQYLAITKSLMTLMTNTDLPTHPVDRDSFTVRAKCPEGTIGVVRKSTDNKIVCRGCSLGHYLDDDQCRPCPRGYYSDDILATKCSICPALTKLVDRDMWNYIGNNQDIPEGSFGIIFCPYLRQTANGNMTLVLSRKRIGHPDTLLEPDVSRTVQQKSLRNTGTVVNIMYLGSVFYALLFHTFTVMALSIIG